VNLENANKLLTDLPPEALVVDVGGGASPFPRADYIIDLIEYDRRGTGSAGNIHKCMTLTPRFNRNTWISGVDLCGREPWPFPDKFFDFAVCSHVLEDVRDPMHICSELQRIAKAGYIETPSRIEEQSLGVEHPRYAGFWHHRWLVEARGSRLEFRHKPHFLHSLEGGIVANLRADQRIVAKYAIMTLYWQDAFEFQEVFFPSENHAKEDIRQFAASVQAKNLLDLVEQRQMKPHDRISRNVFYWRLKYVARAKILSLLSQLLSEHPNANRKVNQQDDAYHGS
jgi:hypothetical protein